MEPPAGVTAHPSGSSPIPVNSIIVVSICLPPAILGICARIFTQAFVRRQVLLEDYLLVLSGITFAAFVGILFAAASAGLGAHLYNVSEAALKRVLVLSNIINILYAPAVLLPKLALLGQIGRLFFGAQKNVKTWTVWALVIYNCIGYMGIFFAQIFACTPRSKIADPSIPGKCISATAIAIAIASIDVTSNAMILILPLLSTNQLDGSFVRRKPAMFGVSGLAIVACASAAVKLYYSIELGKGQDITRNLWPSTLWAIPEISCLILRACVSSSPRLLGHVQGTRSVSAYSKHSRWISSPTPSGTSSKTQILYPAGPEVAKSREGSIQEIAPAAPLETEAISLAERSTTPAELFEPSERPTSHLSYESYMTASMAEIMETSTPVSPISPTYTSMPASPQLEHATQMSLTPVRFATIKKTVDVRISNHTNPGSPIRYKTHDHGW
ncbi:hypothetical protein EJ04DRAFT_73282 [Polyplosphaeria fusca]|uniref:Rhodopsin domain-containing protein n=1 Tax=Polyplosphaeria fusca TaxID=682080 RepID=A0A9P4QN37_9PLEO|nr:hypothetical protein EJ04DRAFT_73282 [Polyplosphaeria fusca]